jgi:hypothetical protein
MILPTELFCRCFSAISVASVASFSLWGPGKGVRNRFWIFSVLLMVARLMRDPVDARLDRVTPGKTRGERHAHRMGGQLRLTVFLVRVLRVPLAPPVPASLCVPRPKWRSSSKTPHPRGRSRSVHSQKIRPIPKIAPPKSIDPFEAVTTGKRPALKLRPRSQVSPIADSPR